MNVLQKFVFNHTNFVSGYVFVTLGTFLGALALIVPPSWRRQVFQHSEEAPPRSKFWYMFNRFIAGVGSFLVVFAVSRASPSIVEAIAGVRYMIVFAGAYLITKFRPSWFKEQFRGPALMTRSQLRASSLPALWLLRFRTAAVLKAGRSENARPQHFAFALDYDAWSGTS